MKNKQVKQMMVSAMVGNRKLFWFQDTSEVYASVSVESLHSDMIAA